MTAQLAPGGAVHGLHHPAAPLHQGTVMPFTLGLAGHTSEHERQTREQIARRIAQLKGCAFSEELPPALWTHRRTYLAPSQTLLLAAAHRLGVRGEDDLFGGVVPHAFVATKAITHPLVAAGAAAPEGWNSDFAQAVESAVLAGFSAFSRHDALAAGEHARDKAHRDTVTREDNLNDMLAAYDVLTGHPAVDARSVALVGSSYGGYLATVLSALRPVRWMALRAPALYKDDDWLVPKQDLDRKEIARYRAQKLPADANRALAASAVFEGDVLLVESENDTIVPHPVLENYRAAFLRTRSMTARVIPGADHALGKPEWARRIRRS